MAPLATVGILSIGEMGMGIAKLLIAHNFRVVTNIEGRRWGLSSPLPSILSHEDPLSMLEDFLFVLYDFLRLSFESYLVVVYNRSPLLPKTF
jgi:hypothetical protein